MADGARVSKGAGLLRLSSPHPRGVRPLGSLLLLEPAAQLAARRCRTEGLGALAALDDEALLHLVLGARFLGAADLARLGACSRAASAFCAHDDLWRSALLREFGGSLAGAVTVRPPDGHDGQTAAGWLEELSDKGLADRLRQALRDTDQAVPDDSRSTLPGFQPKGLVTRTASGWSQPHGSMHSTHILKPQVPNRATRLVDEHYGHLLAQAAGLADFASELLESDGVTFLAIQRFDRQVLNGGEVKLIHQEDSAQALGLDWRTSDAKFQDPHWPDNPARASAARIAQMLATNPGSSALVQDWARRLVLSAVLGDNDAHAKNVALLHTEQGTGLAPAYDTVPSLFARDMIDEGFRLALAVNGSFDHRQVSVDELVAEVQSWRVIAPALARAAVEDAVAACSHAVRHVRTPAGVSAGLEDKLVWTVDRLGAGEVIGTSPWQDRKDR